MEIPLPTVWVVQIRTEMGSPTLTQIGRQLTTIQTHSKQIQRNGMMEMEMDSAITPVEI